jgi:Uma2 family endonuclease
LAVEVLSPDDRAVELEDKIADYLACGVKYVWVVNPQTKRAFIHTSEGMHEAKNGVLRTENPGIELPLSELFS